MVSFLVAKGNNSVYILPGQKHVHLESVQLVLNHNMALFTTIDSSNSSKVSSPSGTFQKHFRRVALSPPRLCTIIEAGLNALGFSKCTSLANRVASILEVSHRIHIDCE